MRVLDVVIFPDVRQMRLRVLMPDQDKYYTSQVPHLPKLLFRLLPRLKKHTCHNDQGYSFRKECRCTEIPHLFEHLILELQLQAQGDAHDLLRGETEWNWQIDPRGVFHVTVDYKCEALARAAVELASHIIHELDSKRVDLDINTEIARLRHIYLSNSESKSADAPPELGLETPLRRPLWDGNKPPGLVPA